MKRLLLNFILLFLINYSYSQELLKIKEVFNFDINDEFHYSDFRSVNAPPIGDRQKIIDKYYSNDSLILYYKVFHDKYTSSIDYSNLTDGHPTVNYFFSKDTSVLTLTNLDSSITYYDNFVDTITEISMNNTIINGYNYSIGNDSLIVWYNYRRYYGKGIGLVSDYYSESAEYIYPPSMGVHVDRSLIYFKKADKSWGSADLTTSVGYNSDKLDFKIFPNPTNDNLFIQGLSIGKNVNIEIVDLNGNIIDLIDGIFNEEYVYKTSNLKQGMYFMKVTIDNRSKQIKFIKQ